LHIERFVRAFEVEFSTKAIELALLAAAAVRWRAGGFGFQRAMHALVTVPAGKLTARCSPLNAGVMRPGNVA
jgi:hypothetical protein